MLASQLAVTATVFFRESFFVDERRRKSALTENVAATHVPRGWIDLRKLPREPVWKAILPRI